MRKCFHYPEILAWLVEPGRRGKVQHYQKTSVAFRKISISPPGARSPTTLSFRFPAQNNPTSFPVSGWQNWVIVKAELWITLTHFMKGWWIGKPTAMACLVNLPWEVKSSEASWCLFWFLRFVNIYTLCRISHPQCRLRTCTTVPVSFRFFTRNAQKVCFCWLFILLSPCNPRKFRRGVIFVSQLSLYLIVWFVSFDSRTVFSDQNVRRRTVSIPNLSRVNTGFPYSI